MAFEGLTVKLKDGQVFYFNAGPVVGDPATRVDLLRDAIDNGTVFRSPDIHGEMRSFNGADVANYDLN